MLKTYWADVNTWNTPDSLPLSEYRREIIARLKQREARLASLCAEALLIEAVRRENKNTGFPLEVQADRNGKPYLADGSFCFNLSHSSHYAACAISDHPIGLDIQILSPCREEVVRRFLAPGEQNEALNAEKPNEAFTSLWCRKESFLKAIGLGLRLELNAFDLSGSEPMLDYKGVAYAIREYRVDDLFFCVCAPVDDLKNDAPISFIKLP